MADSTAFDAIVLGGGPAGLAAAAELRRRGIERLVVLEREGVVGGATRHCGHPPFGLREFGRLMTGPAYAQRLAAFAAERAIEVRLAHSVVGIHPGGRLSIATPQGRADLQGKRVVLAMGAREKPRSARLVTGDRPIGVMNAGALQSYIYLHGLQPFKRPVIVGSELVSLSSIWTCLNHGIRPQMVVEECRAPIARWPLGWFPRLAGIPVRYQATVTDIKGQSRVEAVQIMDASGQFETIECDGLLFTGGFLPEASLLRQGAVEIDDGSGGPRVDQYGRCSDPAYFAAGNVLRSIETAGWCFREGKALGGIVADDLLGQLPTPRGQMAIRRGDGVKLTVPQRISLPFRSSAAGHVQVRLCDMTSGTLALERNGVIVWSKRLTGRPERRILVPLRSLEGAAAPDDLEISFT